MVLVSDQRAVRWVGEGQQIVLKPHESGYPDLAPASGGCGAAWGGSDQFGEWCHVPVLIDPQRRADDARRALMSRPRRSLTASEQAGQYTRLALPDALIALTGRLLDE